MLNEILCYVAGLVLFIGCLTSRRRQRSRYMAVGGLLLVVSWVVSHGLVWPWQVWL